MKKQIIAIAGLCVMSLALAVGSRVIKVSADESNGSPRSSSVEYTGNVKGSVQSLNIAASKATLTAPQGEAVANSEGKRVAKFLNGVTATRNRLTAKGPSLEYKETSGLGVLDGPVSIVQKPDPTKKDGEDVNITASKATFDVDTNVSTSEGSVKLINGKQTAQANKVVFDEDKSLGCLTDGRSVSLVREPKKAGDNRLVITAKETRVDTDKNTLVALGGVKLEAGDNVTTGEALFYDDAKDTAWVIGDVAKKLEAKNVNKKSGATISGGTIINLTRKNTVQLQGSLFKIPLDKFVCPSNK
jgi:lipopolysaccharide export system protein LptA